MNFLCSTSTFYKTIASNLSLIFLVACAQPAKQCELAYENLDSYKKLLIKSSNLAPTYSMSITDGRGQGAAKHSLYGVYEMYGSVIPDSCDGSGFCLPFFATALLLTPFVATKSAINGAIESPPAEQVKEIRQPIDDYILTANLQLILRQKLIDELTRKKWEVKREPSLSGNNISEEENNYTASIELGIYEIKFDDRHLNNEYITLKISAFSKLTRGPEEKLICELNHSFKSEEESISKWSENNGAFLEETIDNATQKIANDIYYSYFYSSVRNQSVIYAISQ